MKKRKENIDKLNSEESIKKQKKLVYALAIVGAIVFYPLFYSFLTKYRLEREEEFRLKELIEQVNQKQEEADIRARLQY